MTKHKGLGLAHKMLYGAGMGGSALVDRLMLLWIYPFYVTSFLERGYSLVEPLVFGLIMFFGRAVDGLADPLIARLSDNHRGKWGRRTPFMALSGVFYVLVFIAIFYPIFPEKSAWNHVYLALMLGIYFFLYTAYVCPYLALLPDIARTTRDRVDLSTFKAVFGMIGGGIGMVGSGILIGYLGFHGMLWAMGLLGLVFLYLPVFIREKDHTDSKPSDMGLIEALTATFKNKPFVIYLFGSNAFWFGFNIITINLPLYITQLMGKPEEETSFYLLALAAAIVFFPIVNFLVKKWGLKTMMIISMLIFVIMLPFTYIIGMPLLGLSPDIWWFSIIGVCCFSIAGLMIIPDAIVAVVSDLEEKISGQRREGMYFGAQGLINKINLGLSTVLSGALLQYFGSPLGIRLTGPVSALFILVGMLIFLLYPEKEIISITTPLHPRRDA
ncbi:MAG: MFS transporter [Firmicutes bacterium]|jgi:GPH family glycoside/pentoside/hexuronide:cation symporter|nr:MFS transporter [Bacillota bacterium]